MEDEHSAMLKVWRERQELFSQCYELQLFLRDAEQRDTWISTKEAFLANQDLGVSMPISFSIYVHLSFPPPIFLFTLIYFLVSFLTVQGVPLFQDNLDSVQALLKKHEDFKKSLDAHEDKIHALESVAEKLTAADHYDAVTISKRRDAIVRRFVL